MKKKNILPVITLYQPWAHWVITELKTIETRTHARFALLNGKDILIHAGKAFDKNSFALAEKYIEKFKIGDYVQGAILGKVHVDGFGRLNNSHSEKALIECDTLRYGLFLNNVERYDYPIPAIGSMGIWYFDLDTQMPCKKQDLQSYLF